MSYSIADARNQLSRVVHEAETRGPVELTRRGEAVAVILGIEEYHSLAASRRGVWEAIEGFRTQWDAESLGIDPDQIYGDVRDRSPGREFSW